MDTGQINTPPATLPLAIGEAAAKLETGFIRMATQRVYQFRVRHPWIYALIAFGLGSVLIAVFAISNYAHSLFRTIDLARAMYEVIFAALAGGAAMVVAAFAYARTVRDTII